MTSVSFINLFFFIGLMQISSIAYGEWGVSGLDQKETQNMYGFFDWRSDLWTSPYQNKRTPVRIYDAGFQLPVFRKSSWGFSINASTEGLGSGQTNLVVGDSAVLIGSDLRTQGYGVATYHNFENQGLLYFTLEKNSASDEPYQNDRDKWTSFLVRYISPSSGNWVWLSQINYSENRGFMNDRIMPVLGVRYTPNENLRISLGYPFVLVKWNDNLWSNQLELTPLKMGLSFSKPLSATVNLFIANGIQNRSYLHVQRIEDNMRLFYQEKFGQFGIRAQISEHTFMRLTAGYSYDRSFYEAKQVYMIIGPRTRVKDDYYGAVGIETFL